MQAGVRDKSSGMSWMRWINTWLHKTINRVPSKSTVHRHIAVLWSQSAYRTKSHDPVAHCCAVQEKKQLTVSEVALGSSAGVCCSAGDFTQRADSLETEEHVWAHTCTDPHTCTYKHSQYTRIESFFFFFSLPRRLRSSSLASSEKHQNLF